MTNIRNLRPSTAWGGAGIFFFAVGSSFGQTNSPATDEQTWNWHVQNTVIVQGYPGFAAKYSGPNSLPSGGETRETVSLDLMAGVRLWPGAEAHVDGLTWQGFGLGNGVGVEGFPNGEAFKFGTATPAFMFSRLFIRQTIGFGGEQEDVPDGQFTLAGKQDVSRLTLTIGRLSAKDIFDNNSYANDPRTQFMNWGLMANEAWDYPADAVGYTTGLAVELNQPQWSLRYGFFQMPRLKNWWTAEDEYIKWPNEDSAGDAKFWQSWGMVAEFERRYSVNSHPGVVRFLAYLNQADMASYSAATAILLANGPGADISAAHAYRYKYGFGLNWEQEVAKNVGIFSRLGWNDGRSEAWTSADPNYTVSLGASIKGEAWHRPGDTFGLAGVVNGASRANQKFLEAGGTGILSGDGNLNYGWEKALETYYDFQIWKTLHASLDYQFISDPAFNRDRGPISVFGGRLHWEF
jgi:high affinity Mn2+ porin